MVYFALNRDLPNGSYSVTDLVDASTLGKDDQRLRFESNPFHSIDLGPFTFRDMRIRDIVALETENPPTMTAWLIRSAHRIPAEKRLRVNGVFSFRDKRTYMEMDFREDLMCALEKLLIFRGMNKAVKYQEAYFDYSMAHETPVPRSYSNVVIDSDGKSVASNIEVQEYSELSDTDKREFEPSFYGVPGADEYVRPRSNSVLTALWAAGILAVIVVFLWLRRR